MAKWKAAVCKECAGDLNMVICRQSPSLFLAIFVVTIIIRRIFHCWDFCHTATMSARNKKIFDLVKWKRRKRVRENGEGGVIEVPCAKFIDFCHWFSIATVNFLSLICMLISTFHTCLQLQKIPFSLPAIKTSLCETFRGLMYVCVIYFVIRIDHVLLFCTITWQ